MPQDNLYDIKAALKVQNRGSENTRLYMCPNGHPYGIGDCGRPWVKATCACGAEIGGAQHVLLQTNQEIDEQIVDKTLPGYCISQPASTVSDIPTDMRKLNAVGFHLERFLINACMYLSAGDHDENLEDVRRIMAHIENDPKEFFWRYMNKDLNMIAKALNLTVDEVMMLWYFVCHSFIDDGPSNNFIKLS